MAPVTRSEDAAVPRDAAPKDAVLNDDDAPPSADTPSRDASKAPASRATTRAPGSSPAERISRVALLLLAAAAGLAVGAVGSFGHRTTDSWLGVSWPIGLLLSLCGLVGLLLGIGELLVAGVPDSWRPTRLPALACASAGWLAALLWITYLGPPSTWFAHKGDLVLANDARSLFYLLGGMLVIAVMVYRAWAATLAARLARHPGAPAGDNSKG